MYISHTLITTDLSDAAMVSLPHAASLANLHQSRVTVLHANPTWHTDNVDLRVRDALLDDVRRTLEAMGVQARVDVVDGEPTGVIDRYIAETNVDLVICTHHARTVATPLNNSVSAHLVHNARCPVLVAHGPSKAPTIDVKRAQYRRIFVASDFSSASFAGLQAAAELGRVLKAQVVVGHVIEVDGLEVVQDDELVLPQVPPSHADAVDAARDRLTEEVEELYDDNVTVDVLCAATAAQGIVAMALAHSCDLVVVPNHGKGAVARFLLGSTAKDVLDLSPLPVLVLRKGEAQRAD